MGSPISTLSEKQPILQTAITIIMKAIFVFSALLAVSCYAAPVHEKSQTLAAKEDHQLLTKSQAKTTEMEELPESNNEVTTTPDWLLGPWRGHAETEDDNDYLEKWNNLIFSPEEATSESEQVDKSENIGVSKLDKMSERVNDVNPNNEANNNKDNIKHGIEDTFGENIKSTARENMPKERINDAGIHNKANGIKHDNIQDNTKSDFKENIKGNTIDNIIRYLEEIVKSINDNIRSNIKENIKSNIQDNNKSDIKENIKSNIDDNVKSNIEDNIKSNIEDNIKSDINDNIKSRRQRVDGLKAMYDPTYLEYLDLDDNLDLDRFLSLHGDERVEFIRFLSHAKGGIYNGNLVTIKL